MSIIFLIILSVNKIFRTLSGVLELLYKNCEVGFSFIRDIVNLSYQDLIYRVLTIPKNNGCRDTFCVNCHYIYIFLRRARETTA